MKVGDTVLWRPPGEGHDRMFGVVLRFYNETQHVQVEVRFENDARRPVPLSELIVVEKPRHEISESWHPAVLRMAETMNLKMDQNEIFEDRVTPAWMFRDLIQRTSDLVQTYDVLSDDLVRNAAAELCIVALYCAETAETRNTERVPRKESEP